MINHFDLFGMRQVWLHLQGRSYTSLPFTTPWAYRYVRHPLYLAWALFFWAAPTMTLGHLLFAGVMTFYMVAASRVEEGDLVAHFGKAYADYRRRVPAFVPLPQSNTTDSSLKAPAPSSENA
jgi:protein-S-isoprenylcysteine O-methyltransferase Ste14